MNEWMDLQFVEQKAFYFLKQDPGLAFCRLLRNVLYEEIYFGLVQGLSNCAHNEFKLAFSEQLRI